MMADGRSKSKIVPDNIAGIASAEVEDASVYSENLSNHRVPKLIWGYEEPRRTEAAPVGAEVCGDASVYSENLSNHRERVVSQNEELHVRRLKAIYTKYNVGDVDIILQQWRGKEGELVMQLEKKYGKAPPDRLKAPVRLPFLGAVLPQGTFIPCHLMTLACILLQQYADENDPLHFATGCVLTAMVVLLLTLGVCGTNIIYTYGAHKYSCLHTNHWL
jgi:hypothetical protein